MVETVDTENKPLNSFKCGFCERTFSHIGYAKTHEFYCPNNPVQPKRERCEYCGKKYLKLQTHYAYCKYIPFQYKPKASKRFSPTVQTLDVESFTFEASDAKFSQVVKGYTSMSYGIVDAIRNKIARDGEYPEDDFGFHSVSIPKDLLQEVRDIVNNSFFRSVGQFIRKAIDEKAEGKK